MRPKQLITVYSAMSISLGKNVGIKEKVAAFFQPYGPDSIVFIEDPFFLNELIKVKINS